MKAATIEPPYQQDKTLFQSTPPVKAATQPVQQPAPETEFQSTPPVKAATQTTFSLLTYNLISIHAAREGGDGGSRHKVWDAYISIHAAREGGDNLKSRSDCNTINFNPRRP